MNFLGIGMLELLVIGGLAYLLLGPKKMGEAGRTVGKALRELRRQRDELTAMLMNDPDEKTPTRSRPSRPTGAAPASDNSDDSGQDSRKSGPPPRSGAS